MLKVIVSGCFGNMGKNVCAVIKESEDAIVVAGVDAVSKEADFPVYRSFEEIDGVADVIIDFSNPSCLDGLLDYALKNKTPIVIATTGYSDEQKAIIETVSEQLPVFFTANMSIGVNVLTALVKKAASVLGNDFDIEIVEMHHNQKIDAPSGTALMLADAASDGLSYSTEYVYDRHSVRKKRDKNEIGIQSLRGGTVVGKHDVIFAGQDEVLTLSHTAYSKKVFAVGALGAARFIVCKDKGLYSMEDLLNN